LLKLSLNLYLLAGKTARSASTEDHQAPSPPLFCEQEWHLAALPFPLNPVNRYKPSTPFETINGSR
jgi:hypothetical protein